MCGASPITAPGLWRRLNQIRTKVVSSQFVYELDEKEGKYLVVK